MKKEELLITAAQARLALPAAEEGRLAAAVTEMLDYFSLMAEVDVENLDPTTHALNRDNALRADNSNSDNLNSDNNNPNNYDNDQNALINRAADNNNNFIVIPNVL